MHLKCIETAAVVRCWVISVTVTAWRMKIYELGRRTDEMLAEMHLFYWHVSGQSETPRRLRSEPDSQKQPIYMYDIGLFPVSELPIKILNTNTNTNTTVISIASPTV